VEGLANHSSLARAIRSSLVQHALQQTPIILTNFRTHGPIHFDVQTVRAKDALCIHTQSTLHALHGMYARRLVAADASLQLRRSDGRAVCFRVERVVTHIPAEWLFRFIQSNRAQPVLASE